jgi:hypothetical protein
MVRLNEKAYEILVGELKKYSQKSDIANVEAKMVMEALDKLRDDPGSPASFEDIKAEIIGSFDDFPEEVIARAAKANGGEGKPQSLRQSTRQRARHQNRHTSATAATAEQYKPPVRGLWAYIAGSVAVGVAAFTGIVWIANLPYPMIRKPVAETVPILLLPSYINMDRNYRAATSLVEEADQLVAKATGPEDIERGAEKVTQAREHLDQLPVWFLGYEPKMYCSLFGCSWRFTFDEFEAARKAMGRLEARVFQEQNAQKQLQQAETTIAEAKLAYDRATTGAEKQEAIAQWQSGLDLLAQIAPTPLAGTMVRPRLAAAERDFKVVVGSTEKTVQNATFIDAAKIFAMQAAVNSQNPPHSVETWQQIIGLWEEAIDRLREVPNNAPGYLEAQQKLAEYQANLATVRNRLEAERRSVQALERANVLIVTWQELGLSDPNSPQLAANLPKIINELEKVEPGTTASAQAQDLLKFAREKLQQLDKS